MWNQRLVAILMATLTAGDKRTSAICMIVLDSQKLKF